MNIKELTDSRVIVIAEFTNNHLGDLSRLEAMIRLAKEAGADVIKLQKRDVDTFYSKQELEKPYSSPFGSTLKDYRSGVELKEDGFRLVDNLCKELGLYWFCSVLDWPSLLFIQRFNPWLIKLPSTISNKKEYIEKVASKYIGDICISTGFTDSYYEDYILSKFCTNRNLVLMQCTSAYPTDYEDCNIGVIRRYNKLKDKYPIIPAYSSHDIGSIASQLAVSAGARVIEKHVKLGNTEWIHFDSVAMDLTGGAESEFAQFIKDIRLAELITGSESKTISKKEHHKY